MQFAPPSLHPNTRSQCSTLWLRITTHLLVLLLFVGVVAIVTRCSPVVHGLVRRDGDEMRENLPLFFFLSFFRCVFFHFSTSCWPFPALLPNSLLLISHKSTDFERGHPERTSRVYRIHSHRIFVVVTVFFFFVCLSPHILQP
jgi:hypothetical protein